MYERPEFELEINHHFYTFLFYTRKLYSEGGISRISAKLVSIMRVRHKSRKKGPRNGNIN